MQGKSDTQRLSDRLEAATSAANIGVWDWDIRTGQAYWSPTLAAIYGLAPRSVFSYEDFRCRVHPDDLAKTELARDAAVRNRQPFAHKFRIVRPDGELRWIETKGRATHDAGGQVLSIVGTDQDITDRELMERALKASEERYRTVVEDQTEVIGRVLPDGTLTFANEVYCRVFGTTPEAVIGKVWHPITHPDDLPMVMAKLGEMSPENPVVVIENRNFVAGNQLRWMQWVNRGIYGADGVLTEIQSVGRDITPLKQLDAQLRASEERLRRVLDNTPVGLVRLDRNFIFQSVNPAYAQMLSMREQDIVGQPLAAIVGEAKFNEIRPYIERALGGERASFDTQIRYVDGKVRHVHVTNSPDIDATGTITGWIASVADITDRKLAELALAEHEERLEMALTGSGLALWDWDIANHEVVAGKHWFTILGYAPGELGSEEEVWFGLVHPGDLDKANRAIAAHLAGDTENYSVSIRMRHKAGHWVTIESTGKVTQRDDAGNPVRMVGTVLDITQRKRLNDEGIHLLKQIESLIRETSGARLNQRDNAAVDSLTKRERQVLGLIAAGQTSSQIATQLHVSTNTVANHRQNLMAKLNVHNMAELTRFAIDHDLVKR